MDRRAFIGAVAGGLLSAPLAAEAQPPGKVFRLGVLGTIPLTEPGASRIWDGFFLILFHFLAVVRFVGM